jgi:SAM-dependent methyltransferase
MTLDMVRKTFTAWAWIYDATHAWTLPGRREARLALGAQRGDRVLDIACGTGLNFPHLHELVGDEGHVMGIDVTPAMLDIARQRIARQGWRNVAKNNLCQSIPTVSDVSSVTHLLHWEESAGGWLRLLHRVRPPWGMHRSTGTHR